MTGVIFSDFAYSRAISRRKKSPAVSRFSLRRFHDAFASRRLDGHENIARAPRLSYS